MSPIKEKQSLAIALPIKQHGYPRRILITKNDFNDTETTRKKKLQASLGLILMLLTSIGTIRLQMGHLLLPLPGSTDAVEGLSVPRLFSDAFPLQYRILYY